MMRRCAVQNRVLTTDCLFLLFHLYAPVMRKRRLRNILDESTYLRGKDVQVFRLFLQLLTS